MNVYFIRRGRICVVFIDFVLYDFVIILSIDANSSVSSLTVATDQVVLSITAAGPAPIKGMLQRDIIMLIII